jgi:hypothetical protein
MPHLALWRIDSRSWLAAAACTLCLVTPLPAGDHLDGAALAGNEDLDLAGLYAFQAPGTPANVVLIMTVSPFAGMLGTKQFRAGTQSFGRYSFQVDTDGDAVADIVFAFDFSFAPGGGQQYTVSRNAVVLAAAVPTGLDADLSGGGKAHAGPFDDPFFFDQNGFDDGLQFTGDDFFAAADVLGIVLEVPASTLVEQNVGVWATTDLVEVGVAGEVVTRYDRVGRPAITRLLVPSARWDEFNGAQPADDPAAFAADVQASIEALNGGDAGQAAALAAFLLPDVLTINTSNAAGFLNGRHLTDDVMDALLNLLSNGEVTTDGVAANDLPFPGTPPYLAPAQLIFADGFESGNTLHWN